MITDVAVTTEVDVLVTLVAFLPVAVVDVDIVPGMMIPRFDVYTAAPEEYVVSRNDSPFGSVYTVALMYDVVLAPDPAPMTYGTSYVFIGYSADVGVAPDVFTAQREDC